MLDIIFFLVFLSTITAAGFIFVTRPKWPSFKRLRAPKAKRHSLAYPPEVVQYYRRRSDSRRELMQLWVEQFIDTCDTYGVRVPNEILPPHSSLRRTLRIYGDVPDEPMRVNGFIPHPAECVGDFDMNEVHDNTGAVITTYTHCNLCSWSASMSRNQVLALQMRARQAGYSGPIDGQLGQHSMDALQRLEMWQATNRLAHKKPHDYRRRI